MEILEKNKILFLNIGILFLGLLIFSHNSPFYPFNEDFDINIDLMTGRLVAYGKIPYVDYNSHRGPCSYLYTMICAMTGRGYHGLFLLECFSIFCTFFILRKTLYVLTTQFYDTYVTIGFYIWFFSESFSFGGKCEECFLWIPAIAIFTTTQRFFNQDISQKKWLLLLFLNGILSGFLFCVKFTFTGVYVGLCVCLLIFALQGKKIIGFFKELAIFLFGMSIVPLICVLWAIKNKAFHNMIQSYIYINIFCYTSKEEQMPILQKIGTNFLRMLTNSHNAYTLLCLFMIIFAISVIVQLIRKRGMYAESREGVFLYFIIMMIFNVLPCLIGNLYEYYLTITLPFSILFSVLLLRNCDRKQKIWFPIYALSLAIAIGISSNQFFFIINYKENNVWVSEFAKEIESSEDKSLLHIYMESSLGNYIKELPGCEHFCYLNANSLEIKLNQIEYLREGKVKYVVNLRDDKDNTFYADTKYTDPYLMENYELIKTGKTYYYYEGPAIVELWRRKITK